ncbi:MAG TPA: hypothetical protein VHS06_08950 [Chloroflexota bacterium]|nr:hypothetical protein [Chloroflexota bacterium]
MKDIVQIIFVGLLVLALVLVGPIGGILLTAASKAVGIQPGAVFVLAAVALPAAFAIIRSADGRRTPGRLSEAAAASRNRKAA